MGSIFFPSGAGRAVSPVLASLALILMAPGANAQTAAAQTAVQPLPTMAQPQPAPPPDHLFGDWDGFRTLLANKGIDLTLDYTTESVANVDGGLRSGVAYAHQIGLTVDADWSKIAGLSGFSTHMNLINRAGNNASAHDVGDNVLQAQEIYGAGFGQLVKLVWLYGEQKLFNGKIDIDFGRIAPGTDFAASPHYCSFMTLTICGHPRALTANQGFEDWPMSEWGAQMKAATTNETYVMVGAFQSQPFPSATEPYTQGGHNGWDWTLNGTTGVSIPVEFGYEPKLGPEQLPGHYKIGFDWDTSHYPDNFFDIHAMPIALTGLSGREHDGRAQFWATADQMIWQHGQYQDDGLYLLAAYAYDDPTTSLFHHFLWGGLIDRGLLPGRPEDQLGFAVTYYDVSKRLTETEQLQSAMGAALAGGALGIQKYGMVYELNYNAKVYQGVQVQPELEYFQRPGATGAVPNSFLVGLKTYVLF